MYLFRVTVGDDVIAMTENTSPTVYKDVVAYFSSPWSVSATNAEIRNFQISSPLTPCGATCTFVKEDCPKANVQWKGTKVSSLLYGATGAVQLKLTILNNDKTTVDIRKARYTAFMMVK